MRTRTAVAVTALALAAFAAPASAADYVGGCRVDATSDRTLGGQNSFAGTIVIDVVADPLASVAVRCDIHRNGTLIGYDALSATGTGAAANAGRVQFEAEPEDEIAVCAAVSVNGDSSYDCDDPTIVAPPDALGDLLPRLSSAVVGYVFIQQSGTASPTYRVAGALADPTLWSCSDNGSAVPYAVTCDPVPNTVLGWKCDVLHADVFTTTAGARAQTELDCDGGGAPEAATRVAHGVDHDSKLAASAVLVTRFRCTVSNGAGGAAVPSFVAGCGDPGAPTVE